MTDDLDDRSDTLLVAAVALVARVAVLAWAGSHFPASEDGAYYAKLAARLASGAGYTWLWPDGVVTYAAHYPVGYPLLVALGSFVAITPGVLNAALGVAGVAGLHRVTLGLASRRAALVAGLLVALHPALLFYVPAVMTEGVTASLLGVAAWLALRARGSRGALIALGVTLGVTVLVRPQTLVFAPLFGLIGTSGTWRRRLRGAAVVLALSIGACLPWTARNCVRMKHCALVSVNGGWNLLIGNAPGATGHWNPIDVPAPCREVYDEAEKDACFGEQARGMMLAEPGRVLALVPKKLAATFDYVGAAPWYLHSANRLFFPWDAKVALGTFETAFVRLTLLVALFAGARLPGPRRWRRAILAVIGAIFVFQTAGWVAYLCVGAELLLLGSAVVTGPPLLGLTAAVLFGTAAVHAIFFGAGRYALPVLPFVTALGAALLTPRRADGDTPS